MLTAEPIETVYKRVDKSDDTIWRDILGFIYVMRNEQHYY